MFSYRHIFRRAFNIAWKNRYLWFFGIFASLLSIGAEYRILERSINRDLFLAWFSKWQAFFQSGLLSRVFFHNLFLMFKTSPWSMTVAIVVVLLIIAAGLILIWLAVVSQTTIVKNTEKIIKNKNDRIKMDFHGALGSGAKYFWPVLWTNIAYKILVNLLVVLVVLPLILLYNHYALSLIVYIILFLILVPVAICVSLFVKYAMAFIILKKQKWTEALKSGWELFLKNWIISVEMAFLLFVISFLATFVILIAAAIFSLPFIFLVGAILAPMSLGAALIISFLGMLIIISFVVLCGSLLSTFQIVSWTHLFLFLLGEEGESKIERLAPETLKREINF
jgi:hypothetical protein